MLQHIHILSPLIVSPFKKSVKIIQRTSHNLASGQNYLRVFCSRFSPFSSLFWLFFRLRCEAMNPCWIRGCELTQKFGFIASKRHQTLDWNIPAKLFCSILNTHATFYSMAFSWPNFQTICDKQHFLKSLPWLLARALSIDSNPIPFCRFPLPFLAWSPHLVDQLRCLSWRVVRLRWNSTTQYFIAVNKGVDYPRVKFSSVSILVGLTPLK